MKEYLLNYYPLFKCIGGACKHTCCAGWGMYIDNNTLESYKNDTSSFSKTLKKGVDFKRGKFKDKKGRCAFLNDNGLCDIILNLGESHLCQICSDHPRFKSYYETHIETGLGFCCEEATKIILSYPNKIEPILVSDDGNSETLSFIQNQVLLFKEKALSIIQNRNQDITERIYSLLSLIGVDNNLDFKKGLKRFISLERLNKSWGNRLKSLTNTNLTFETDNALSLYCEQFLVNSLYRHLSSAEDITYAHAITLASLFSWVIIKSVYQNENTGDNSFYLICDIVREFSSNVEYSESNLDKLFNFTYKYI